MSELPQPTRLEPVQIVTATVLTFIAGYVDAVGFLRLSGVYIANMSGNTIAIGLHLGAGHWRMVAEKALPVGCYVLGLIYCRIAVEIAFSYRFRRIIAVMLFSEIAFLSLFMISRAGTMGVLFGALAMGTQGALLTRFSGVTIYTTFIQGTMVKFADSVGETVMGLVRGKPAFRKGGFVNTLWFTAVYAAYVAGALAGAPFYNADGVGVIILPILILGGYAIFDIARPSPFRPEVKS